MENQNQTKGSITSKLAFFYFFLLIDLILASFIEVSLDISLSKNKSTPIIEVSIIQIVVTILVIIMFFVLLWNTFPLRKGMLSELFKYFKNPILASFVFLAIHILERITRLMAYFNYDNRLDTKIWDEDLYRLFYYIKYLSYPFFYGFLIDGTMKLALPKFYNPEYWMEK